MSAARTMTARYRGTCALCAATIAPGDTIAHAGRGRTYCAACHTDGAAADAGHPARPRYRSHKARYGRCEDAPCCGCCGPY